MSEPISDARLLFSPPPEREPSTDAPLPAETSMSADEALMSSPQALPDSATLRPFVEIPAFSPSQLAQYGPVSDIEFSSDLEYEGAHHIVGEGREGKKRHFYVRYTDGLIRQVRALSFRSHFPHLIEEYAASKAAGTLLPFDSSSSEVHPSSRPTSFTVKIPASRSRQRIVSSTLSQYSSDELARDLDSDDYTEEDVSGKRRSTRAAAAKANTKFQSTLPFSPKNPRTRRRAISVHSSESDAELPQVVQPTRKSTRVRTTRLIHFEDEDFEDLSDRSDSATPAKPKKKRILSKASRPAYGHFRTVLDLRIEEEDSGPLVIHRGICEKCHSPPAHKQSKRKKGRSKKRQDDDSDDEPTRIAKLGGWVRCLKCPVVAHWGCLAQTQRDEILRAALEREKIQWQTRGSHGPEPRKRPELDIDHTTEFICGQCMKGGICMGCKEMALTPDEFTGNQITSIQSGDTSQSSNVQLSSVEHDPSTPQELLFRCFTCKRLAHYAHLPIPDGYDQDDTAEIAGYYQDDTKWKCADCFALIYMVEHILAWRPFPENAVEPPRPSNQLPNHKALLPREYLVKWADRSYRRVQWVPHGWLLAVAPAKLKTFLLLGTKVPLLSVPVADQVVGSHDNESAVFEFGQDDIETQPVAKGEPETTSLTACPDAEKRIPPAWRTVDRVLDIRFWRPHNSNKKGKKTKRVHSSREEDESDSEDTDLQKARLAANEHGEEPPSGMLLTIEEFEYVTGQQLDDDDVGKVAWAFIKWDDLGYEDASWDSPPLEEDPGYALYVRAFKRLVSSRSVVVRSLGKNEEIKKDGSRWERYKSFTTESQPELGQDPKFKLMPFQIDGVNWLCHNWNIEQNCILADEMGLGKTVQVVTFIGYIVSTYDASPALVVVPNSTITNWVREFERWAPGLRVVPFYGEVKAREVIKRFELFHDRPVKGTTGAKFHVLVTTYETVTNTKEFGPVFKRSPRWETLVVDEGQRLKNDASLTFKRLKELNTLHRIIMTGTPLNNNIRELFNLMNFLDPDRWDDLVVLSKYYEELTDEKVSELHSRLKPYFLRRIKSEVLQLPPKNEVIVPISMAPLQKEIYRSILSQNLEILQKLAEGNVVKGNPITKTNMNNMLMQLRKCLQHPYLVSDTIEPRGLPPQETHDRLIGASAKLRLLKMLLPKLQQRGHRVLLFSQFVIALDIVEDFLVGEGIKFRRIDGSTKQADRQKGMDEFNKPDSDIFIYMLSTRAGGVGINLWSADTVIIFDPDFNPHQDLQAIARAHRYGQQKTVLVFKLMVKDSAEERIMQAGKKKLVLDHLIVQNMDDEGGLDDVQSILLFGAKALFEDNEETAAREVQYSEHDIDNLIEKTEKEGDVVEPDAGGAGSLFAFAKVWSANKDSLEDLDDVSPEHAEEADSWAKALELIAARKATEKQKELTGRGVRRKAAAVFPQQSIDFGDSPKKDKAPKLKKRKKPEGKAGGSDDSDFQASDAGADSSDGADDARMDVDEIQPLPAQVVISVPPLAQLPKRPRKKRAPKAAQNVPSAPGVQAELCGLCNKQHASGRCPMTEDPENLAQYRLMLMQHAGEESPEERRAAIRVIDETLHRLGKIHLIYGQPLHLVEAPSVLPAPQPAKKLKANNHASRLVDQTQPSSTTGGSADPADQPGPSRMNGSLPTAAPPPGSEPRMSHTTTTGPSKRPTPPTLTVGFPDLKKGQENGAQPPCIVCGGSPVHWLKDCPVVAQGPSSISGAIRRLSDDPAQRGAVDALKSILIAQQRQALAKSAAQPTPPAAAIDRNGS